MNIPLIIKAKEKKIPVIGDIELFYRYFPNNIYIGITGTDGKTTTTTLVYEILKAEKKALLGGNIGIPVFDLYNKIQQDSILVFEISSFQLEAIDKFKPKIAAFLNLAPDHLDRYKSMEEYLLAKKRIFMNQNENDYAIVNLDSPYFEKIVEKIQSKILTFSTKKSDASIYFKENIIYYEDKPFINRNEIFIKGLHNVENAMVAILVSKILKISDTTIKKILSEFKGVEHRIEYVRTLNGIEFYNDSKSTTVNSLEKALLSFEKPIVLIAGGRDKGLNYKPLRKIVKEKIKFLVLIGEAKEKLKNELDFEPYQYAHTIEEAIKIAFKNSVSGDVILLSPACTSFDMFQSYEERGKVFKEIVNNL